MTGERSERDHLAAAVAALEGPSMPYRELVETLGGVADVAASTGQVVLELVDRDAWPLHTQVRLTPAEARKVAYALEYAAAAAEEI